MVSTKHIDPKYWVECKCGRKTHRQMTKELAWAEWNGDKKGQEYFSRFGRKTAPTKIR